MLVNRDMIRAVFIANGFTIKEGQTDLKEYVYKAAEELMELQMQRLDALSSEVTDVLFTAASTKDTRKIRNALAAMRKELE